jgi:hypothetical protein
MHASPLWQNTPLHLQYPSLGSHVVAPAQCTRAQRSSTHVCVPPSLVAGVQNCVAPHTAPAHLQVPVDSSHSWFAGQATSLQFTDGLHSFDAGSHTSPSAHSFPPVPPHRQVPSYTSQLVPGFWLQSTPEQRVDRQVFEAWSQTKPIWHWTPPWPPHLQIPSSGSQINVASSQTMCFAAH